MLLLEERLQEIKPDCVIVYGDTDSTLAACITVVKLLIPLVHVEAGPRTYCSSNPEEQNRLVVDHLANYLCTPDAKSYTNLVSEGIDKSKIYNTGDVMYDEFLYCSSKLMKDERKAELPARFVLMTWHRQENTCSYERMNKIVNFIKNLKVPIVLPLHPRTKKKLIQYELYNQLTEIDNAIILPPVGYSEMIVLMNKCSILLSDSGGASKEISFAGKKCIYMLNLVVWPELVESGYIYTLDLDKDMSIEEANNIIRMAFELTDVDLPSHMLFGSGDAAKKIVDMIENEIIYTKDEGSERLNVCFE